MRLCFFQKICILFRNKIIIALVIFPVYATCATNLILLYLTPYLYQVTSTNYEACVSSYCFGSTHSPLHSILRNTQLACFLMAKATFYALTRQTELQKQTAVVVLCTCGQQLTLTDSALCLAHHALAINRGQGVDCNILPSELRNIGVLNWSTSFLRHYYQYRYVIS